MMGEGGAWRRRSQGTHVRPATNHNTDREPSASARSEGKRRDTGESARHPLQETAPDALLMRARQWALRQWDAPMAREWRERVGNWPERPYTGAVALLAGTIAVSLLIAVINRLVAPLPNPGVLYLPLIAMLAYHWSWRHGAVAGVLQLVCVSAFFITSTLAAKPWRTSVIEQLVTLLCVDAFILALVQLARARNDLAEREAMRLAALNAVGAALASELDETRLLRLIAQTARDLTGAGFAAFTLRPLDAQGRPLVPAEGNLFHLAAVVGVTPEQEALFRRIPLGGEGLLAPIFRYGATVRIADALAQLHASHAHPSAPVERNEQAEREPVKPLSPRDSARAQAAMYAHGEADVASLQGVGVPRGHPIVRSFLGAPLLDREGKVRGGLLLGDTQPGRFTPDDELLLQALAAQAAVAIENARLFLAARNQARELDAVFESISDGVSVLDGQGVVRRQNRAALAINESMPGRPEKLSALDAQVSEPVSRALAGEATESAPITIKDADGDEREYLLSAAPLRAEDTMASPSRLSAARPKDASADVSTGAVVVWHDVTATRRWLVEREARTQAEAQRTLLQMVIDELPSGVYLVHGDDVRLALANRAATDVWGAQWPTGMPMSEFLANSGTTILSTNGQPLTGDELATVRALRTGEAVRHHLEIIRQPGGASLPVLLNAVALESRILRGLLPGDEATERAASDESTEPAALVVLQDVTPLKEAERLKDEFIAIAAHELKTPMAAVKGYTGMLLRRSRQDEQSRLVEWQREAMEIMDQATDRLVELTNDLLDVTRIQAGRMELHPEPHDLVALARRVVKRFQGASDKHTLGVVVEGEDGYVVACIDVSRTEQVLGNLLSNAIKYSPNGGAVTVTVRPDRTQGVAELRVRDTGIGIPGAEQARLFHRFSRAENARDQGIPGTGLGLYLCRELVTLQGGRIWFTSIEGHGTTFFVAFPLAEE